MISLTIPAALVITRKKVLMSQKNLLKFAIGGNAKIVPEEGKPKASLAIFNLPAGHTCPGANECLAKFHPHSMQLEDGPKQKFRCYAASQELVFTGARTVRWHNKDLMDLAGSSRQPSQAMADLILASLHPKLERLRIHGSGDFYNQAYFDAWVLVAKARPEVTFYAYTKSLKFWVARMLEIPDNFFITASKGGKQDHLIEKHGLKYVEVVPHPEVAEAKGLEIDHDDTHAYKGHKSFALLMHGMAPAGSPQSLAQSRMREEGIEFSYPAVKAQVESENAVEV